MKHLIGIMLIILAPAMLVSCGQDITLQSTGTVYGDLVYTDGSPASGIVVVVEGANQNAVSDPQGRFVIGNVLAVDRGGMGKYYTVRGYGDRGTTSVGFLVAHFKVKGQQSYSIGTVTVQETGSITGTILLEGETDHSGVFVHLRDTSIQTVTRADGSYAFDRVPAFEGYVLPCSREGYENMDITHIETGGVEKPVQVDPGASTDLGTVEMLLLP